MNVFFLFDKNVVRKLWWYFFPPRPWKFDNVILYIAPLNFVYVVGVLSILISEIVFLSAVSCINLYFTPTGIQTIILQLLYHVAASLSTWIKKNTSQIYIGLWNHGRATLSLFWLQKKMISNPCWTLMLLWWT